MTTCIAVRCPHCHSEQIVRHDKTACGTQRYSGRLDTVRGQHLDDLMDDALRHGQRAVPDVDGQQQLGDWINCHPHPVRRVRQACDGLGLADLTILDGTEEGIEFV